MPEDRYIQMLKVSLPYMNSPAKENCKLCIQLFEIMNTINRLEQEEESLSACSNADSSDPLPGLYQALKKYCTPKETDTLDMLINVLQMTRLYHDYESGEN